MRDVAIMAVLMCGCTILSGCAAEFGSHTGPAPTTLRFEVAGWPMGDVIKYEVTKDGFIERTHTDLVKNVTTIEARRRPSNTEWEAFWRDTAPLSVWQWKKSYSTLDVPNSRIVISDGFSWDFLCRSGSRRVHAGGGNAYPTLGQPQVATLNAKALNLLIKELKRLAEPTATKTASNQAMQRTAR